MNRLYLCLLSIVLLSSCASVNYVGNRDGQTVTLNVPKTQVGDRLIDGTHDFFLADIDVPRLPGKCKREQELGLKAKSAIEDMLSNAQTIGLIMSDRQKTGRPLAEIYADEINICDELLDQNLAVPWFGGPRHNWCD